MRQAVNTQRDEEIRQKRKEGMGLKEIAEKYGISIARAGKICGKTGYIKKKEPKEVKPPKDTAKRWVVKSGAAEAYLTKIDCGVYIYATKDKRKALKLTREDAEDIAKHFKGEVRWV